MTRDQALDLVRELEDLVPRGPGNEVQDRDDHLGRIQDAFARRDVAFRVHENAIRACYFVAVWLTPGRWEQWGSDPERLRSTVMSTIDGLRRAVDEAFPTP